MHFGMTSTMGYYHEQILI